MKSVSAMIQLHYIKRRFYKPVYTLVCGLLFLGLAAFGIIFFAPTSTYLETGVVLSLGLGLCSMVLWGTKKTKIGLIVCLWILLLLLLRRFDLLSWLSFAGTLLVVGVLTLFN